MARGGSNGPRLGSYNRNVVLDAIREADGISRVELAGHTALTPQTVSNIVRRLIDDGLVVESGQIQGEMGKPRSVLRINVTATFAVGVHIDPTAVTCVVVDFSGRLVSRVTRRVQPGSRPATVVGQISTGVEAAIARAAVDRDTVGGVGIAAPGSISVDTGEVVDPPNLPGWDRVPLQDTVSDRLALPVMLDNDATAAAMGERWVGGTRRSGPFAFIYLGTGIGCGLVLSDQVFRGFSGNAGELGHISIDTRGPVRHCGNRGCLEAYIAPAAIGAQLAAGRRARSVHQIEPSTWAGFAQAYAAGDPSTTAALREAADRLADATVSLVNLFDLPRVVIGGRGLGPLLELFTRTAEDRVNQLTMARSVRVTEVVESLVGDDAAAIGAASLVLHGSYAAHSAVLFDSELTRRRGRATVAVPTTG